MIGKLETAALRHQSASEGPLRMSEQFAFAKARWSSDRESGLLLFLGLVFSLDHTLIATLGNKYSFPPTLTIIVV